jgi:hypothetical protein
MPSIHDRLGSVLKIAALDFTSLTSLTTAAAPIQWSANGHYYDIVDSNIHWDDAKSLAEAMTRSGMTGHLGPCS